jgi:hypothetical protein
MSATLPPTAGLDRPSDFGEFWQQSDPAPRMNSVAPETEPAVPAFTPQQSMRRRQLQGMVAGVVSALVTFTALAATIYAVKRHHEAALVLADAAAAAKPAALVAAPTSASQPAPTAASPSGSEAAPALAATPALRTPTRLHAAVAHPKPAQTRLARPSARKPLSR